MPPNRPRYGRLSRMPMRYSSSLECRPGKQGASGAPSPAASAVVMVNAQADAQAERRRWMAAARDSLRRAESRQAGDQRRPPSTSSPPGRRQHDPDMGKHDGHADPAELIDQRRVSHGDEDAGNQCSISATLRRISRGAVRMKRSSRVVRSSRARLATWEGVMAMRLSGLASFHFARR